MNKGLNEVDRHGLRRCVFTGDAHLAACEPIIQALVSIHPESLSAKTLMQVMGIQFSLPNDRPSTFDFVRFLNMIARMQPAVREMGFRISRSSGTPSAKYWLERI